MPVWFFSHADHAKRRDSKAASSPPCAYTAQLGPLWREQDNTVGSLFIDSATGCYAQALLLRSFMGPFGMNCMIKLAGIRLFAPSDRRHKHRAGYCRIDHCGISLALLGKLPCAAEWDWHGLCCLWARSSPAQRVAQPL